MSPLVGTVVHLVVAHPSGPHCVGVAVVGHCDAHCPGPLPDGPPSLHLRRLDARGEVIEHVPHSLGDGGPVPRTWHRTTVCA